MSGQTMSSRDWLLLAVLAAMFSGSFIFNRVALTDLPPLTVVLGRVGLAAIALNLVLLGRGQRLPWARATIGPYLIMGALSHAMPFTLIVWGQTAIDSGLASILNAMTPLSTILAAHVLSRDDRLSGRRLAGVVIGLTGAVVVIGPASLLRVSHAPEHILGQLAVLGATVCYALAVLYGRRFDRQAPLTTAAGNLSSAALFLLPAALLIDRPWTMSAPAPEALGALAGLALISTAVAYVLFCRILATAGPTNLTLVTFLIPIGTLLVGAVALGERIEPRQLGGMVIIFAALAVVDGRLLAAISRLRQRRLAGARLGPPVPRVGEGTNRFAAGAPAPPIGNG